MPKGRRSVADAQNYGDDVPARDLIHPPAFSDLAMAPDSMKIQRTKEKVIDVFNKIGYDFIDSRVSDVLFDRAAKGGSTTSINAYRNVLNDYLDSIETGHEDEWRAANGIPY